MSKKTKKDRKKLKKDTKKVPNEKSPETEKSCKPSDELGKRALVVHGDNKLHTNRAYAAKKSMEHDGWKVDIITYALGTHSGWTPPWIILDGIISKEFNKHCEKYAEIHFYLHTSPEGGIATFDKNAVFVVPAQLDGNCLKGKRKNVELFAKFITDKSVIHAHSCFSCANEGFWEALRDAGYDVRAIKRWIIFSHSDADEWEEWDEKDLPALGAPERTPDHTGHEPWRRPKNWCRIPRRRR